MAKTGTKFPSFCLMNKIKPHIRVASSAKPTKKTDNYGSFNAKEIKHGDEAKVGHLIMGRKIMIVADSSSEAEGALQWALSHTVQSQDKIILLYVITKLSRQGKGASKERNTKAYQVVNSLKNICRLKKPEVQIEVAVVEGKERGPTIVEEAKKQEVSLLVLGQKKSSTTWRLLMIWAGHRVSGGGGVVGYCIQNASCMAIAVRRKSKKVGGYLITTKRQKDFWLLA